MVLNAFAHSLRSLAHPSALLAGGRPSWCDLRHPEIVKRSNYLLHKRGWYATFGIRGIVNLIASVLLAVWLVIVIVLHTDLLNAVIDAVAGQPTTLALHTYTFNPIGHVSSFSNASLVDNASSSAPSMANTRINFRKLFGIGTAALVATSVVLGTIMIVVLHHIRAMTWYVRRGEGKNR